MATCTSCGRSSGKSDISNGLCVVCRDQATANSRQAKCASCGRSSFRAYLSDGICPDCQEAVGVAARDAQLRRIILTTETAHNLPVSERIDIVTAEVVIGMHLFKDVASAFSDIFGGRSKTMQTGLREARKAALTELRQEAYDLGADAVVGVDLDYSEISGGGKSMLFLVASGTAVKLQVKI